MDTEARKAARAKHTELMQTTAVEAATAAVENHTDGASDKAINLPQAFKDELKKYLPQVLQVVWGLGETGINAGLDTIPFAGHMAEGIVDPLWEKLEPVVLAKTESLLGL